MEFEPPEGTYSWPRKENQLSHLNWDLSDAQVRVNSAAGILLTYNKESAKGGFMMTLHSKINIDTKMDLREMFSRSWWALGAREFATWAHATFFSSEFLLAGRMSPFQG